MIAVVSSDGTGMVFWSLAAVQSVEILAGKDKAASSIAWAICKYSM